MKIDWLRYFVVLSETMNFHAAATRLHITPQALSKSIAGLETHYKYKLFERKNSIKSITPVGKLLLSKVINILSEIDLLELSISDFINGEPQGEVKIACPSIWQIYLLPKVLIKLKINFPKILPQIYTMITEDIEKHILCGEISIGLSSSKSQNNDIKSIKVYETNYIIVGTEKKDKSWQDLDYIVPRLFNRTNYRSLDGWDENKFVRKIIAEVEILESAINMAVMGLGVAFVPQISVNERIKKEELRIVSNPPFIFTEPLYILSKKSEFNNLAVEQTIKEIKESLKAL